LPQITPFPQTIAVLRGGWSAEREVSLKSGAAVLRALAAAGYTTRDVIVDRDLPTLLAALTPRPDVVFNALHGTGGEDGVVQGVLEMLDIPYTHSGVLASAVAMDKPMTKTVVAAAGVTVPGGVTLPAATLAAFSTENPPPLPFPFVIKPVNEGSSVGVFIVRTLADLAKACAAFPPRLPLMAEAYIPGREITVPVLGSPNHPHRALPVIEIVPKAGFYDYAAKYGTDTHADFVIPAPLPEHITRTAQDMAIRAHQALGCRGVSRADFRYDETQGRVVLLEVNTQPGMTDLSLTPASAAHAGLSFLDVVQWLLDDAGSRARGAAAAEPPVSVG
jgi:D-alanine-D-alanine ligase